MINRLEKIKEAPDFAIFSIQWLERIFLCGAILISIYTWLKSVDFTPDSTNYIVAGKNLLQFHQFFVYTHWPSHSLDLKIEPFTDFPPGFSILFAGFLFLAKDLYFLYCLMSEINKQNRWPLLFNNSQESAYESLLGGYRLKADNTPKRS